MFGIHLGLWHYFSSNADLYGWLAALVVTAVMGVLALLYVKKPKSGQKYRILRK